MLRAPLTEVCQVKNEVTVLKRVAMTHRNIVNLYDHFEVRLCF